MMVGGASRRADALFSRANSIINPKSCVAQRTSMEDSAIE
jgi:hypothetical protein